ncbi:MAG: hypothetical protein WD534_16235 [Phycisphaeraceae bacterium]
MSESDSLIALLRHHDGPCPNCGYNLRGIARPVCPECGKPVRFDELVQPHAARVRLPWLVTLISLAAALPVSFTVWQRLLIRRRFYYGRAGRDGYNGVPDFAHFDLWQWLGFVGSHVYWLSIPVAVLLWLALRRRIERLPAWLRWTIAVCAVVAVLLAHRRWQFWWYYTPWADAYAPWPFWFLEK